MTGKWIRLSSYQKAVKYNPAFVLYANPTTSTTVVAFRMAQLERGDKLTEWKESIADQQQKQYYLTLNGHSSDFSIDATADGEVIELTCATNGTPRIQMLEGDAIESVDIQGDIISIATILNPSSVLREAIVVMELEEDPAISITVLVKQAAAVIPSIAFNPNLPWSSSAQTVTILNNGNVPLSIVYVPSFISNAGLPISLAPRAQTTRRISANNTGVPRSGTISMEYSDALGQMKIYNVSVKQNA